MRWRDMKVEKPPRDGNAVLALGNEEAAIVWYDPSRGATWVVMHLPLRGETISDTLYGFHSWCPVSEWHRQTNGLINPSYYSN